MVVGEIPEEVDLLVAGAGPGGYVGAIRAAQLGRNVLLIDKAGEAGVGGTCLNVGCIPSKALIEVADASRRVADLQAAGLSAGSIHVDLAQWQEWRKQVVSRLTGGIRKLLRDAGVTIMGGHCRLSRPGRAVVETSEGQAKFFEFRHALLATGSRVTSLSELPRDGVHILDSTDALALEALPSSLVVVGGGYVGLEMGTAFAKLGVPVTIVESMDRLLPNFETSLVAPVHARLRELGVNVLLNTSVIEFDGEKLKVSTEGDVSLLTADKIVVAVGRTPNTDDLGLDLAGLRPGAGGLLDVGPDMTLTPQMAAVGDITPGIALAHKASSEALVAVAALSGEAARFDPFAIPAIVFTDPEIATAGMSVAGAEGAGIEANASTFPVTALGRAATIEAKRGFVTVVTDRSSGIIIGVHIVGPHASELIGEGVLAIEMGATVEDLATCIHPHPTLSEQLMEASHLAMGWPIHVP